MDDYNESCEPMDIDLSDNSLKPMDITKISDLDCVDCMNVTKDSEQQFTRLPNPDNVKIPEVNNVAIRKQEIKKYYIKISRPSKKLSKLTVIAGSCLLVITLAIVFQNIIFTKCIEKLDLVTAKNVLNSKLFGQHAAVELITETLMSKEKSKLLILYGGTGIGKTYAISLIFNNVWESLNVYHYTATIFINHFSPNLMIGMTFCETSIIIIDSLNHDDMNTREKVSVIIKKAQDLQKNLTMILVYNCDSIKENFIKKCDMSFRRKLETYYASIEAKKIYVPFENLNEEHLKRCLDYELGDRKIAKHEYDNILKNFNVTVDGCKGVYAKMKYLNVL